jgi:hypothetical protein
MRKNKKGSRFTEKSHGDEDYNKILAYAEKKGVQIWEVSLDQLVKESEELNEKIEENEFSKDNNEFNSGDEDKNTNLKETIEDIEEIVNTNLNFNNKIKTDESFEKEIKEMEVKFPILSVIGEDITMIIEKTNINNFKEKDDSSNKIVKFSDRMIIYEYPKEEKYAPVEKNKNKKKKKKNDDDYIEKTDKNKNECDDFNEEEMKRLEEARKRREEYAYLEKLRIEEEEEKKQENAGKQSELENKQKVKNKYKPKPKKKKGK